ncbi:hypothetical protein [Candidatus Poriferisodalis sp.]|uniref:hypothetical protein n=1 Tax=Candidatus Poriferisodalis sp. TaxID=3101277 RepID=UPI003B0257B0
MTEHDGGQAVEPAAAQQTEPPSVTTQTIAPDHRHGTAHQRSTTLLATVLGAVVTALLGGMFLFIVSALDRVSDEISSLRDEMNARFAETDRRFDQVNSVLMDHTDRLARIETTLDISGRPLPSETGDPAGP